LSIPGVASPGGAGYDFLRQSIANRIAWRTNGLSAHPGLRHWASGSGTAGADRISGRGKSHPEGPGRLKLSDAERATLGEIGHRLGRKVLGEVANVARPDTILAWYRKLVARKYDGSNARRSRGRPSGIIKGRAMSYCSLGVRTFAATGMFNAASDWADSCAITIRRQHERGGRLR
jgi:hypothetical protein